MNTMKAILSLSAIVLATGCADVVERRELDDHIHKTDKEFSKLATKNDVQALVGDELVKRVNSLDRKVDGIDTISKLMEGSLKRLEDQMKTLQARIEASPPGIDQPPVTTIKLEDIHIEMETVLAQLRGGTIKTDDAAARLKIHAQHAAPRLVTEIRDSITRVDYTKQLEIILSKFPPSELKTPFQGALTQRGARESVARVIGATGDREISKILEEHLSDPDEDFRLALGDALVRCRNGSGIPLLLGCLKSDQGTTRTIAIAALKHIHQGEDLGYRSHLGPEQNATAIKAWEEWSAKSAKTLFE